MKTKIEQIHVDYYIQEVKLWENMKDYINGLRINDLFSLQSLRMACELEPIVSLDSRKTIRKDTLFDVYKYHLMKCQIIEFVTFLTYKKLVHIPEKVDIAQLKEISKEMRDNPWKEWFTPLHEKLGVTEEELYKD